MRILLFTVAAVAIAQPPPGEDALLQWMNAHALQLLDAREREIAAIQTREAAKQRQSEVRRRLLELLGGLPDYRGPLHARETGRVDAGEYRIEKIRFESLPGLYVTANIYRPRAEGRYPAVLLQSGHTQEGKPEPQITAANLALQGYVAMTFDPLGQGEREQSYHAFYGRAMGGGSVNEHLAMGAQSMLFARSSARYFIHDARRAIDYLEQRPDVDRERIGAAGCSGGGALTAWVGALDERVRAVAVACYINTYRLLYSGRNPDTEMSLPRFLHAGLDMADIVGMTAPKPWLLLATEEDYFTPAGVQPVYDEARRWFGLFGAAERVRYFVAPGEHGTPRPTREEIYNWMDRWLRGGKGGISERPVREYTNLELRVTRTGNVHDEPGSRRLHEILREESAGLREPGGTEALRRRLAEMGIGGGPAPEMRPSANGRVAFLSEPGVAVSGRLYLPGGAGRKPAVVLVEDTPRAVPLFQRLSPSTEALAASLRARGYVVLELEPRDSPSSITPQPFVGNWLANTRADMIGRNLPAMRARDILRGVDLLAARADVDAARIHGVARGVKGIWMLLAAAADSRLRSIWVDRTPASYQTILDRPLGQFLFDGLIPGFYRQWDLGDLRRAIAPRAVFWSDPTSWMNDVIPTTGEFRYRYVGEGDEPLLDEFLALR